MFRFKDPLVLLLFIILPLIYLWHKKNRKQEAVVFSSFVDIKHAVERNTRYLEVLFKLPRGIILALLILALARPQLGNVKRDVYKSGIDIILALDTSGSMKALDFTIGNERAERLTVVKKVVSDFVKKRSGDRIGVVAFGTQAATRIPLTTDYSLLEDALSEFSVGMVGDSTSIGVALALSLKRLESAHGKSRIIILLTDGRSNAGKVSPELASQMASKLGVKLYTIGVGTKGKAPFLVDAPFGGKRMVYQEVELDEDTLKKMAENTGGRYFLASDTKSLEKIYDEIDKLERTEVKVDEHVAYEDLFGYFLWPGFLFLLLEVILLNTRLVRIP